MRSTALAAALALQLVANVASCGFTKLGDLPAVLATCCESVEPSDCSGSFPASCTTGCAELLVPFWEDCSEIMLNMGFDAFDFDLKALSVFVQGDAAGGVGPCKHTLNLFEAAKASGSDLCSAERLPDRIKDVNEACCEQDGVNECGEGIPWGCDADCSLTLIPFWENCIVVSPDYTPPDGVAQFQQLYDQCTSLPKNEIEILVQALDSQIDSPTCQVNVDGIVSIASAADMCSDMDGVIGEATVDIPGGPYTCPGLAAHNLCEYADAACCGSCPEDPKCAAGGCRRRVQEEFIPLKVAVTDACPWDQFDDRDEALTAVCCGSGMQSCINGLPMECTFTCGRMLETFLRDCQTMLTTWVKERTAREYTAFMDKCYHLDVRSVVMAIYSADCHECGDGVVQHGEGCDEGDGNCNGETCTCHTNCQTTGSATVVPPPPPRVSLPPSPPGSCEEDAFPICENMITTALKSCTTDYCEMCPEAHSCDKSCGLPCGGH